MGETKLRSLMKGLSWRVIASLVTVTLIYLFTGDLKISAGVGFVEVVTKIIFYYLHERIWGKLKWDNNIK